MNAAASRSDSLSGRAAVVTGASGGIGAEIAVELARRGADVLVHGRANRAGAEQTAARILAEGRAAEICLCDLAEPKSAAALVDAAYCWRERIDLWVNNAGADVLTGEAGGLSFEAKLQRLWEVDVLGTIRLTRTVGAKMAAAGAGAIVNIGWDQADHGMAGDSGELFAAAKGAIMAFTRSAAQSLGPSVRVNLVAPGWIETAWGEQAPAVWRDRAVAESVLARWGQPSDVAAAVAFLASDDASFLTGCTLPVNGGFRWGRPDLTDGAS